MQHTHADRAVSTAAMPGTHDSQCQVSPADEADSKLSLSEYEKILLLLLCAVAGDSYIQAPTAVYTPSLSSMYILICLAYSIGPADWQYKHWYWPISSTLTSAHQTSA